MWTNGATHAAWPASSEGCCVGAPPFVAPTAQAVIAKQLAGPVGAGFGGVRDAGASSP